MSVIIRKQNYKSLFLIVLLCYTLGDLLACIFVRVANTELISKIAFDPQNYFSSLDFATVLSIVLKEYAALFLVYIFSFLPFGRVYSLILSAYKGFCLGIISSILCISSGSKGIFYILFLLLPQNFIYLFSLYIAIQKMFNSECQKGKHTKTNRSFLSSLMICFVFTSIGLIVDLWIVPFVFGILQKG